MIAICCVTFMAVFARYSNNVEDCYPNYKYSYEDGLYTGPTFDANLYIWWLEKSEMENLPSFASLISRDNWYCDYLAAIDAIDVTLDLKYLYEYGSIEDYLSEYKIISGDDLLKSLSLNEDTLKA